MEALKKEGFKCSSTGQCLLCKKDIIITMFVDDIAFACKDPKAVDKFVEAMRK